MKNFKICYQQDKYNTIKRIYDTIFKTKDRQERYRLYRLACLIVNVKPKI